MAAFALILAVAACDKGDKKDDKGSGSASAQAEGSGSGTGSASASGSAAASGAGSASGSGSASAVVDTKAAEAPAGMTGDATCDQLIAATQCMYEKMGNVPPETKKMFEDGIAAWKTALGNDATRQATIDACKMSLDGGKAGFEQLGCSVGGSGGGATAGAGFGSGAGLGSGGGGTAVASAGPTGAAECDELIARTRCSFDKVGSHMPQESIKAFDDAVKMWQESLAAGGAMRTATTDACKMALESGKAGFEMSGCGGPEHGSLLGAAGGGATATVTAGGALPEIESVGEPTCDKLIERTMCMYKKAGSGVPASAIQAFADGVKQWKEMLQNASMKSAIVDACKQSLDGAEAGFKAMGC